MRDRVTRGVRIPAGALLAAAPFLLAGCARQASHERPNVLFIMSDDHAANAIGSYGSYLSGVVRTPSLDRIAAEGARLTRVFCTNSICAPSRATILTGQYSHQNGVYTLHETLRPDQPNVAKEMRRLGYQTAVVGKWHLKADPAGFDDWNVMQGQGRYRDPRLRGVDGEEREYPGYSTDVVTDLCIDWLEKRDPAKPFFLMCHYKAPHDRWTSAERFDDWYRDEPVPEPPNQQREAHGPVAAVGIASFGPVDPDPGSATFGFITSTPKPGWANTDLAGAVGRALGVPVGFDTDVNGAGLGEWYHGAARGLRDFVYLTVGTGIGGGGMTNGRLTHGLIHPEMGHVRIPHDRDADPYPGGCPFHGDCLEGLASGPALAERWGRPAEAIPADHPAWPLEARYLALALANTVCTLSPQRIIVGGGVMAQPALLPLVRSELKALLAGYVRSPAILDEIDSYVVAPGLGGRAGLVGALALARNRLDET